ncbi:armadillo-type protein [Blastocladiella britannica]|nr:armadillo-type protein [Blastocladiella britannica]
MDPEAVLRLLEGLCSQHVATLKDAEQVLKRAETMPDFHRILLEIVLARDTVAPEPRWMAARTLRANIDRHWRKSAKLVLLTSTPAGAAQAAAAGVPFSPPERAAVRSLILAAAVSESDPRLLVQLALSAAKIARLDFPNEWPSVLTDLLGLISSASAAPLTDSDAWRTRERALVVLHHVTKQLVTVKLDPARRHVQDAAPAVASVLIALFNDQCAPRPDDPAVLPTALYALKCLRKLLVYSIRALDDSCRLFLESVASALDTYFRAGQLIMVTNLGKLVLELQEYRGLHWLTYPGTAAQVEWYTQVIIAAQMTAIPEKIVLQALLVLKHMIRSSHQFTFASETTSAGTNASARTTTSATGATIPVAASIVDEPAPPLHPGSPKEAPAQYASLRSLLTRQFAIGLTQALVSSFLLPTAADVEKANSEDALEWVLEEDSDPWEFKIRGAASRVVMELVLAAEPAVAPVLVGMAQHLVSMAPNHLGMVAVVSALAGSADRLQKYLPVSTLLTQVLFPWMRSLSTPEGRVPETAMVGRVVCAAIKAFVVSLPASDRPPLYNVLATELLVTSQPIVVQLAAVDAFRVCVDEWELDVNAVLTHLPQVMERLLQLLGALSEFDLKIKVVYCLSTIIERLDGHTAMYAPAIVQYIPSLWEDADDQHLFQATLLVMLQKLAAALKTQSVHLHAIAVPLLQVACVPGTPQALYFLEDALALWRTLVQQAENAGDYLGQLVHLLPPLLETGSEALRTTLSLVSSYLYLDPQATVNAIGEDVLVRLAALLGPVPGGAATPTSPGGSSGSLALPGIGVTRPQASAVVLRVLETFLVTDGAQALQLMINTGVMYRLIHGAVLKLDHTLAIVAALTVLARAVFILEPAQFALLCGSPETFEKLLNVWLDIFDHIGHPSQRKLSALALTRLLPAAPSALAAIAAIWTDVLHEVNESEQGDANVYWRMEAADYDDDEDSAEVRRRRAVMQRDAIHAVSLSACVKEQINALGADNVVAALDPDLVLQLQPLLH